MKSVKVVVQFKDRTIIKGSTGNFSPNKKIFHLLIFNGDTIEIDVEQLKAIFFVKDLEGNSSYIEDYSELIPGGGKKIQVEFLDGEIIIGYSQGYSLNRPTFFLVPADTKSNNERIFIIKSATKKVTNIQSPANSPVRT
jgi:hypothetical protein